MDVDRKIRISFGLVMSLVVVGIAALGWIPAYDFTGKTLYEVIMIALAKTTAFGGLAMFAWSLILSARYKFLEGWFSGLDKMYVAHRFFGTFSVVMLFIHPLGLMLARLPQKGLAGAVSIWVSFGSVALVFGMISLYGLIAIAVWSIAARARHETFLMVHRTLGFFFIAGALHAFMAGSVLAAGGLMYWYMLVLCIFAVITFLHYSLLSDVLHRHYAYTVESVRERPGGIFDIRLQPRYRILKFQPGQFAYVYFSKLGIHGYHPFTIASGTRTSQLQFLIKAQGDFTSSLGQLRHGDEAKIRGPYGGFLMEDQQFEKQLWIAGGIGITPFLSKARSLKHNRRWPDIRLVYATRTKTEAAVLQELQHIQHVARSFHVTHLRENKFGIVSLSDIQDHLGDLREYAIFVCGPPGMLGAYAKQASELGLERQVYYEEFGY